MYLMMIEISKDISFVVNAGELPDEESNDYEDSNSVVFNALMTMHNHRHRRHTTK